MNWKQEAVERLKNYTVRREALRAIPEQIEEVELKRRSIRAASIDGTAVRGGGSGREQMLLDSMVRQEELQRRLEMTRLWVSATERALNALTEEERLVLDRLYIHPARGNVDRLCEELGVENPPAVYKRKDKALQRFVMALYGWEEV